MIKIALGIFFILHGLVHFLYFGQSARIFELKPGMVWPEGTWALSKFIGSASVRNLAGILLIIAAMGFIVSGIGIFARQIWWRPLVLGTAVFSSIIYLMFWDGIWQNLDNKGGVGILINLAILATLLIFYKNS
jgi:hypothetical protein